MRVIFPRCLLTTALNTSNCVCRVRKCSFSNETMSTEESNSDSAPLPNIRSKSLHILQTIQETPASARHWSGRSWNNPVAYCCPWPQSGAFAVVYFMSYTLCFRLLFVDSGSVKYRTTVVCNMVTPSAHQYKRLRCFLPCDVPALR